MVHISIIIPAYNEENRIKPTLQSYLKFFKEKKEDFEILVVLDGCTDNTKKVVEDVQKENSELKYLELETNRGKGRAITEGYKKVDGDLISYVDADNCTKAHDLYKLIKSIGEYDGVMGSRWMDGSVILTKQPLSRRIAGRGFNLLVRLILGLPYKDTQAGAKVFKKQAIKTITPELKSYGWAFDVGVLYELKKKGFRVKEVPIVWEDSKGSKLRMKKAIPAMFLTLIRLRFSSLFG